MTGLAEMNRRVQTSVQQVNNLRYGGAISSPARIVIPIRPYLKSNDGIIEKSREFATRHVLFLFATESGDSIFLVWHIESRQRQSGGKFPARVDSLSSRETLLRDSGSCRDGDRSCSAGKSIGESGNRANDPALARHVEPVCDCTAPDLRGHFSSAYLGR